MATNINYVLIHKSNFFDPFLNDLQTVSKEYQKQLKKVGILRVKSIFEAGALQIFWKNLHTIDINIDVFLKWLNKLHSHWRRFLTIGHHPRYKSANIVFSIHNRDFPWWHNFDISITHREGYNENLLLGLKSCH